MSNAFLLGVIKAVVAVAIVSCSIALGQTGSETAVLFGAFVAGSFVLPRVVN